MTTIGVILFAALSWFVAFRSPFADTPAVATVRFDGNDRYATAADVARAASQDAVEVVLLASGDALTDALAGTGLAGALSTSVVLTDPVQLSPPARAAIDDLDPERVLVLGTDISEEVVAAVQRGGQEVERIAGPTRYDTAAEIARRVVAAAPDIDSAFLASGESFADALAAGAVAASAESPRPVLLTQPGMLPDPSARAIQALGLEEVFVVGGEAVVAQPVIHELQRLGVEVRRLAGSNRQLTAVAIADALFVEAALRPNVVTLVRGDAPSDALAAAAYAGDRVGPLLLVADRTVLGDATEGWLEARCGQVRQIAVVGGPGAIADDVLSQAVEAAENCRDT